MSKKDTTEEPIEEVKPVENKEKPKCFVIMPISDHPDYDPGHFDRVYEQMIKPAVLEAGFEPTRADDTKRTHIIILEILKAIVEYDMAICDMSSLNPNVMYELGIRQMNRKPVVLIKDEKTRRIFDTGLMSDIEYSHSLRIDKVKLAIQSIALSLKNTHDNFDEKANSLIDLLGVDVQVQKKTVEVTEGEKMILDRLGKLERQNQASLETVDLADVLSPNKAREFLKRISLSNISDIDGTKLKVGDIITNAPPELHYKRLKDVPMYVVMDIDVDVVKVADISNKTFLTLKVEPNSLLNFWKVSDKHLLEILTLNEQETLKRLRTNNPKLNFPSPS
jgi:hypothetical protein